jgi:hypothetical protein
LIPEQLEQLDERSNGVCGSELLKRTCDVHGMLHFTWAPKTAAREQVSQSAVCTPELGIAVIVIAAIAIGSSSNGSKQCIAHATLHIPKRGKRQVTASGGTCIQQPSQKET